MAIELRCSIVPVEATGSGLLHRSGISAGGTQGTTVSGNGICTCALLYCLWNGYYVLSYASGACTLFSIAVVFNLIKIGIPLLYRYVGHKHW